MTAQDLGLRRGRQWLVRRLHVAVKPGALIWLRGENGSGKTTLLRTLAGLSRPAEGSVFRSAAGERPLYIGHQSALKDDLDARVALRFLLELRGHAPAESDLDTALECWGVRRAADRPVRTLSQGQQRRIALCRLLLEPATALWLLDEPLDALDDAGVALVHAVMGKHVRTGGAVVLTSHIGLDVSDIPALELDLGGCS